jgi:GxxExxY protein
MSADSKLTEIVIGAAYTVHNELGEGFLEAVYVKALSVELTSLNVAHNLEMPLSVHYKGQRVGEYRADIVVENCLVLEIKAVTALNPIHEQQLVHYLHATRMGLGLLINFGRSVIVRRKVLSTNLRQSA